jgi:hypothetical protein
VAIVMNAYDLHMRNVWQHVQQLGVELAERIYVSCMYMHADISTVIACDCIDFLSRYNGRCADEAIACDPMWAVAHSRRGAALLRLGLYQQVPHALFCPNIHVTIVT